MCITFLYTNPGDFSIKYKLVLINNRDEYYARKTQKATLKVDSDKKHLIYSTDLEAAVKGTWLGLSKKNGVIKVGNLANITGETNKGKEGRGPLVLNYIESEDHNDHIERLLDSSHEYSSFNLLSVEINNDEIRTFYVSNIPKTSHYIPLYIPLGFIGMSNSPLKDPFKKVDAGTEKFQQVLENHKESSKEDLVSALMEILMDKTSYLEGDEELLARRNDTAEFFSSIHVEIPDGGYGTRTRTVILVDNENNVDYIEETMSSEDPRGEWEKTHLKIPKI